MTHAWLITGPPGSGRSVAALCFAAALECTAEGTPGCGRCRACTTTMAGTHGDVRRIIPEGLSIGVEEMRAIVAYVRFLGSQMTPAQAAEGRGPHPLARAGNPAEGKAVFAEVCMICHARNGLGRGFGTG